VLSHRSLVRSFLRRPLSLLQMDALEQTLPLKLAACASSAHVPCPGKLRLVPALPYDGSHLPRAIDAAATVRPPHSPNAVADVALEGR
jgi:hypothetical protein